MPKVFIGSTSKDLVEYRDAAIEVCNRLGLIPIAMEHFEAMGSGATRGSKDKLDQADVYVGIFAYRYGYIEAGQQFSVTEIEFDHAGQLELQRLCFLVAPDYPWPPDLIDYENYARLKAFKDRVLRTVIRAEFTTVDDFKAKLMQSLFDWQRRSGAAAATTTTQAVKDQVPVVVAAPRPALVIGRAGEIAVLKARLGLGGGKGEELTIVRGWPGVGKTTLITSLAYDADVIARFHDGILWAALGETADVPAELSRWCRELGVRQRDVIPIDRLIGIVRNALRDRKMLLIVDDVWQLSDAVPFKQTLGPNCSLLLTTRFGKIAQDLAITPDDVYRLDVLSADGAFDLLQRVAPTVTRRFPADVRLLLEHIEYLPLAIRVAGRLLESEASLGGNVSGLMQELRDSYRLLEEAAPDDRFDARTGTTPTIGLLLERSTEHIDETTRRRFAMLGPFAPKPATFDLEAIKFVWQADDPMTTIRKLVNQGLLEPLPGEGRFQMHAVLVMHARRLLQAE